MTRGTNVYVQTRHLFLVHPGLAYGFHDVEGDNLPWAAAMLDANGPGTRSFPVVLSHEIIEAMTDVSIGDGWATDEGFLGASHSEACDTCGGDYSQQLVSYPIGTDWPNDNYDVTGVSQMTTDWNFAGVDNIPDGTCQAFVPLTSPQMTAVLEPNRQGVYLDLFYRTVGGQIAELTWPYTSSSASGPVWWGSPPYGGPAIVGKPVAVRGFGPAETRVFIRGQDNAIWMLSTPQGNWQSLGGIVFGDPSAVVWDSGQNPMGGGNVNVFALGIDDNIWTYGITNTDQFGWSLAGVENFVLGEVVGSIKAFSRSADTIDLFAGSAHGSLLWTSYTDGWNHNEPSEAQCPSTWNYLTPVGVASSATDRLDMFANIGGAILHQVSTSASYTNLFPVTYGGWGACETVTLGLSYPIWLGSPAAVSFRPGRLDVFAVDNANRLFHAYRASESAAWQADALPLATDAGGEPTVISRDHDTIDVFYRTTTGSLTHLQYVSVQYTAPYWNVEANILPAGSVD